MPHGAGAKANAQQPTAASWANVNGQGRGRGPSRRDRIVDSLIKALAEEDKAELLKKESAAERARNSSNAVGAAPGDNLARLNH